METSQDVQLTEENPVANERLRGAITAAGLSLKNVADHVGVDPKTVERWVKLGRLPHPGHRLDVAAMLKSDVDYLWPEALSDEDRKAASNAELVALYPSRGAVPRDLWIRLIEAATERIEILVYAGLFLPDGYPHLAQVLAEKAQQGVAVRLALGDPTSDAVALRGEEEGIGEGMAARIHLSLSYLREAIHAPAVETRLHSTTLYNSIYRADQDILVNAHAYGAPAAQSPVIHLRRIPCAHLFQHYESSFERVWQQAAPLNTVEAAA